MDRRSDHKDPVKRHRDNEIELLEDVFGLYVDDGGVRKAVKRFTWRNHNNIQAQVISYGARVVSLKMPDRYGKIADLVLGCEDLAGYLYFGNHYLGATIGRVTDKIRHGTFTVNGEQIWVTQNQDKDQYNGGFHSLDSRLWTTYTDGTKVVMSIISPHLDNGYPGDLMVRVTFELNSMNEFKIDMEAQTTAPTIVNLSNLTYFNLAGHNSGPDELYKHQVTLNCNCFTSPEGEVFNVVHTPNDFQVPVILGKVMGISPKDGYDLNLCVNRGCHQKECFVARAYHVPSGRVLELYSDQPSVRFTTANGFGPGDRLSLSQLLPKQTADDQPLDEFEAKLLLFRDIHQNMSEVLRADREENFNAVLELLYKLNRGSQESLATISDLKLSLVQKQYLEELLAFACSKAEEEATCARLRDIIRDVLSVATVLEPPRSSVVTLQEKTSSQLQEELRQDHEKLMQRRENLEQMVKARVNHIPPYYKEAGTIVGKGGIKYKMHAGFAFQSQNHPDAVNMKNSSSCAVNPGELYKHSITYKLWLRAGNPRKWIKRNFCNP